MKLSKTTQKLLLLISKVIIIVVAWWYLYNKIVESAQDFEFIRIRSANPCILAVIVFLILVNWGVEAKKWQTLILRMQPISYIKALQGTLIGLAIGFVTPNRIGDIGGRSIVLKEKKKKAMVATSIGSLLQLMATIIFGLLGILFYIVFFPISTTLQNLFIVSFFCTILIVVTYFVSKKKRLFQYIIFRVAGESKYRKIISTIREYPPCVLTRVLILSCLRYIVFFTQYILLLKVFVPEMSFVQSAVGITIMYLFVTVIPSSILGEIGVRGSVAVFVFGLFLAPVAPIFQVSLLIWFINLAIPVFVGSVLLLLYKIKKTI